MAKLYHIQAEDPCGENLDWFILADTPKQAELLWNGLDEEGWDVSDGITRIREIPQSLFFSTAPRRVTWPELPIVMDTTDD